MPNYIITYSKKVWKITLLSTRVPFYTCSTHGVLGFHYISFQMITFMLSNYMICLFAGVAASLMLAGACMYLPAYKQVHMQNYLGSSMTILKSSIILKTQNNNSIDIDGLLNVRLLIT